MKAGAEVIPDSKSEALGKEYWESVWQEISLPQAYRADNRPETHRVLSALGLRAGQSLIEVGCAPGRWMAYFSREFGLSVSGIEYAENAYRMTLENMRQLEIEAQVHLMDFLEFQSEPYDVVFSTGFIEHFPDPAPIVRRLVDLSNTRGGIVITIIPNMQGINRWISRTFRPAVAAGHYPISLSRLVSLHEQCDLRTIYRGYLGPLSLIEPVDKNRFAQDQPRIAAMGNLPFRVWNKLVKMTTRSLGMYPQLPWISTSLIYVGVRESCAVE